MPLQRRPVRIRWWIFAYMCAFAMLAYIQRQSISVAADSMMPALHLTKTQIAWLGAAFVGAYAIGQLPGGLFAQRFGARLTYVLIGVVGCLATLATPLAPVVLSGTALFAALLLAQAVLGFSQGPVFPAFAVVLQDWFPSRRWALGNGLQTAFMDLGGAVTPIFVAVLTASFGWQGALLWIAPPAVLLTAAWAWYGRNRPGEHAKVTTQELAELDPQSGQPAQPVTIRMLLKILVDRDVGALTLSYLLMNYTFYLITFWSFLYLVQQRHFSGIDSGLAGAVPWVGAGLGAGIGGYLSDWLAVRLGVRWGYRLVPLLTLPTAGVLLLVTINVATPYAAVAALTLAFAAVEINEGVYWAATMRVARGNTGAATGVLNTGANLGGLVTHSAVGFFAGMSALSENQQWNAAFMTGTVLAIVSGLLWLLVDPARHDAPAVQPT